MELISHFEKFLSTIEPTYYQKSEASTGHTTLRDRLQKDEEYKAFFNDSFISGSYGRHTAIKPINDVDIIIITNHSVYSEISTVFYFLEKALKRYYSQEKIRRQKRSVRISLSYVTMDVVPSITTDGVYGQLMVPDRNASKWVVTHLVNIKDLQQKLMKRTLVYLFH